jgi:hypothetical protein
MAITLTLATFLGLLGFATWIVGNLLQMQGVGTIGAVLVVGLGAAVTGGGLEYAVGETQVETEQPAGTETVDTERFQAEPGTFQQLNEERLVEDSETVEWYNSSNDAWRTLVRGDDYEMDYRGGEVLVRESAAPAAGDDMRIGYNYTQTETVTEITQETQPWEPPSGLPLGYLLMLLGSLLMFRSLNILET